MEKPFNNINKLTKKIIKEGGLHQPSDSFLGNVMEAVTLQTVQQEIYRPLISKKIWIFILITISTIVVILYLIPPIEESFLSQFNIADKFSFENQFSDIKISKTILYGFGFLALFLIQIPFLKRYFERDYQL